MFSNVGMDNATATTHAGMLGLCVHHQAAVCAFWKCTAPKILCIVVSGYFGFRFIRCGGCYAAAGIYAALFCFIVDFILCRQHPKT